MAEAVVVDDDVVEQILIRLDAKDLNRYKRVCKSWHSLITSHRFVSRHLKLSYKKDGDNNKIGHRKVSLLRNPASVNNYHVNLVGSSNGLVCISSFTSKFIVGNPLTREVRQLPYPYPPYIDSLLCCGFGYDSSTDDYKVIVGVRKDGNRVCFWLWSLKSNAWRDVGEKKYDCFTDEAGILCNGALHWLIVSGPLGNKKNSILSYDLCKDEFKEIPLPHERCIGKTLGIFEGCLGVFGLYSLDYGLWVMKRYNVIESWELVKIQREREMMKYDIVHTLRLGLSKADDASWFCRASEHLCWEYMNAPVYVQSLVSPHDSARGEPMLIIEDGNKGRKKGRTRSSWVRFVCCSSVNAIS